MVEATDEPIYVFTKEAVLRSIRTLEDARIHEHFPGYIAILRGAKLAGPGEPIRSRAIWDLHNRYMSVEGSQERSIYVRPFKSRGKRGIEIWNPNVAGSYGASSIRARGKLSEVIEVEGEGPNAVYALKDGHAALARQFLLKVPIPVGALAAFFYRDYGFHLDTPDLARVIAIFRDEFGLSPTIEEEQKIFDALFLDDAASFKPEDLEQLHEGANG